MVIDNLSGSSLDQVEERYSWLDTSQATNSTIAVVRKL